MRAHSLAFQGVTKANGTDLEVRFSVKSVALKDIPRNNFARAGRGFSLRDAIDDRAAVVSDRDGSRQDSEKKRWETTEGEKNDAMYSKRVALYRSRGKADLPPTGRHERTPRIYRDLRLVPALRPRPSPYSRADTRIAPGYLQEASASLSVAAYQPRRLERICVLLCARPTISVRPKIHYARMSDRRSLKKKRTWKVFITDLLNFLKTVYFKFLRYKNCSESWYKLWYKLLLNNLIG